MQLNGATKKDNTKKVILVLSILLFITSITLLVYVNKSLFISYYSDAGIHDCFFTNGNEIRIILKDRIGSDYTDAFYVDSSQNGKLVQVPVGIDKQTGSLMFSIPEPVVYVKQEQKKVKQKGTLTMNYGKGTCSYISTAHIDKEKDGKIVIGDY